ncbi:iron ABC transporter substrate-binding protein [Bacillus cereus]|uniref:iron ABC transporter substrate-binding protein n=1 Tax=Bacillus sp. AFS023182 TaxID=2033492 RepID=UPI000BFA4282|nr:iron ABC transporter substrate-binding protein [Bacillus sp. AFS023182]PFE04803.1 iron ABC transporter substrate-binding protein [Bacillus sp. AFS023182]PGX96028.1 iron ABC transporter substrate-binding protein [Bacillus cereus]
MYIISIIIFLVTLCILGFAIWKIHKIKSVQEDIGEIIATYPRKKSRWFVLFGPAYFFVQLILTYVRYIDGEIGSFELFLLKIGAYTVAVCFMILFVIQLIKDVKVYEKGVIDGMNYYSYAELKGYKTSTWENPQENIFLYRGQEKWHDNVNLLIRQEDMRELENILQRYLPKLTIK